MKKFLLGLAAATLVLASSCKKSEDNSSSWTVGSTSFGAQSVNAVDKYMVATGSGDAGGATLTVQFAGGLPANSGTFKVVEKATAPYQLSFSASFLNGTAAQALHSIDSGEVKAKVVVYHGKVIVDIPPTDALFADGLTKMSVSAHLSQTN